MGERQRIHVAERVHVHRERRLRHAGPGLGAEVSAINPERHRLYVEYESVAFGHALDELQVGLVLARDALELHRHVRRGRRLRHQAVLAVGPDQPSEDDGVRLVLVLLVLLFQVEHLAQVPARYGERGHARLVARHELVVRDYAVDEPLGNRAYRDADHHPAGRVEGTAVEQPVAPRLVLAERESDLESVALLGIVGYLDPCDRVDHIRGRGQRHRLADQQQQTYTQLVG